MKKIPLTKNKFAIVDDEDYEGLLKRKWQFGKRGYVVYTDRVRDGFGKVKSRLNYMHRLILKPNPTQKVDHINGDKLDNRKVNLRIVTTQQNNWNSKIPSTNTSGFKGVSEDKRNLRNKWQAYITVDNRKLHLGYFATKEEAAGAYNNAAEDIFGEYARLNNLENFTLEHYPDIESVRQKIKSCEGFHTQQAVYSTFHDALTQVCYICKKIRTNL